MEETEGGTGSQGRLSSGERREDLVGFFWGRVVGRQTSLDSCLYPGKVTLYRASRSFWRCLAGAQAHLRKERLGVGRTWKAGGLRGWEGEGGGGFSNPRSPSPSVPPSTASLCSQPTTSSLAAPRAPPRLPRQRNGGRPMKEKAVGAGKRRLLPW